MTCGVWSRKIRVLESQIYFIFVKTIFYGRVPIVDLAVNAEKNNVRNFTIGLVSRRK